MVDDHTPGTHRDRSRTRSRPRRRAFTPAGTWRSVHATSSMRSATAAAPRHRSTRRSPGIDAPRPTLSGRKLLPIIEVKRPSVDYTAISTGAGTCGGDRAPRGIAGDRARFHRGAGAYRGVPVLTVLPQHHLDASLCILCGGMRRHLPRALHPHHSHRGHRRRGGRASLQCPRAAGGRVYPLQLCIDRCPTDALSMESWSEASTSPIALQPITS